MSQGYQTESNGAFTACSRFTAFTTAMFSTNTLRTAASGTAARGLKRLLVSLTLAASLPVAASYEEHPEAITFIADMVEQHEFTEGELRGWLSEARQQESILEAIARPAERTRTWAEYRPIFLQPLRVERGIEFWREHSEALGRVETELGVPAELVVAIIGVETNYGRTTGTHRVIDALTTLAFDYPPRAPFFRKELAQYFILMREHEQNPLDFKGSYAGAMGYGQFMPSSYRHYAIDFDGDDFADIWNNPVDAIGSVANYFAEHGWQAGQPVAVRARAEAELGSELDDNWNKIDPPEHSLAHWSSQGLKPIFPMGESSKVQPLLLEGVYGDEHWFALHNFYVITRYNRSHLYAMATYQLSLEIKAAMENDS